MAKSIAKQNVIIWKNCRAELLFYDGSTDAHKCEVKFEGNRIVVSYKDEDGYTTYEGESFGGGHFQLLSPRIGGRATLHMFNKGKILEGSWQEGEDRGMWRITLH